MDQFQTQIKDLIVKDELEKVIELFQEVKDVDAVLISSRWTSINRQRITNTINNSEFEITKNKIKRDILELIELNKLSERKLEKPNESQGLLLHANELFDLKAYAQSLHYYKKALSLYPQNEKAVFGYAKCLYNLQSFNAVLDFCKTNIKRLSRKDRIHNLIGIVNQDRGYFTEAKFYYELALNEKPESRIYFHNILLALKDTEDFKGQIHFCTKYITTYSNQAYYYYRRSKIFEERFNELDKALEDINTAISLENSNSEFYYLRAIIQSRRKEFQAVLSDINIAYDFAPSNQYLRMAGAIFHDNKYFKDALAFYSRALAIDPKDYSLYYNRADTYYQLGSYKKALTDINFCINHLENNQSRFDLRQDILRALKR